MSEEQSQLDLVFAFDVTSSMGSYIAAAQRSVISIVQKIVASESADVRFAIVAYRDHPPQDSSFVTQIYDFTSSMREMDANVRSLSAQGGGDGPEAVAAAMKAALDMPWRKTATRICVLIADAPPHGIGCSGDGFPDGDPDGVDPVQVANSMRDAGIILYAVACEPSLSNYGNEAVEFYAGVAEITSGQFLPLTSSDLLADVIVGGAEEELSLQRLASEFRARLDERRSANPNLTDDALEEHVYADMMSSGLKAKRVEVSDAYNGLYDTEEHRSNVSLFKKAGGLGEWRAQRKAVPKPKRANAHGLESSGGSRGLLSSIGSLFSWGGKNVKAKKRGSARSRMEAKTVERDEVEEDDDDVCEDALFSDSFAVGANARVSSAAKQEVNSYSAPMSREQVSRMLHRHK